MKKIDKKKAKSILRTTAKVIAITSEIVNVINKNVK